ncbi:MAG: DNA (cytosine-5-)-methyltransferase, partial [Odoribacteraceae bacterium]|nr:DNA (cytosine-5-)-methyltransferase [Odoribacteraceae bacterium]
LKGTRFRVLFANDILEEAFVAWSNYFKRPGIYHRESVVDLVRAHRRGEAVFPANVDVVTGGFPCQDFSLAGKRRGFDSHKDHHGNLIRGQAPGGETRGQLYTWMKEVIDITTPRLFIAENVKGLVNLQDAKEVIQRDFSSADGGGYLVLPPRVLNAADFGVPQARERVIFIGIRRSALTPAALAALSLDPVPAAFDPYPRPTHAHTTRDDALAPPVTLGEVFASLPEPDEATDPSQRFYSMAKYMGAHCQGQKEVSLGSVCPTIRSEHHGNIEFRRLSAEHGGRMTDELAHGMKERRLTPRECAVAQTFPMDYPFVAPDDSRRGRFLLSASSAYRIIGNAVPPLLAYHLAKRLEQLWPLYFGD